MPVGYTICLLPVSILSEFLYPDELLANMVYRYEEQDEEATTRQRILGALKYCIGLVVLVLVLFLVGLFVPVARDMHGHVGLDYFRRLLLENRKCILIKRLRVMC